MPIHRHPRSPPRSPFQVRAPTRMVIPAPARARARLASRSLEAPQPVVAYPQPTRLGVRLRSGLLVQAHVARQGGPLVVPRPILRTAAQKPRARGVEANAARGLIHPPG